MTEKQASLYCIEEQFLLSVAYALAKKAFFRRETLLVLCEQNEQIHALDRLLWTKESRSFLAHGTCFEDNQHEQPIYLTNQCENPAQAGCILILGDVYHRLSLDAIKELPGLMRMIHVQKHLTEEQHQHLSNFYAKHDIKFTTWKYQLGQWVEEQTNNIAD